MFKVKKVGIRKEKKELGWLVEVVIIFLFVLASLFLCVRGFMFILVRDFLLD